MSAPEVSEALYTARVARRQVIKAIADVQLAIPELVEGVVVNPARLRRVARRLRRALLNLEILPDEIRKAGARETPVQERAERRDEP